MQGHIASAMFTQPCTFGVQGPVVIVVTGNEQCRQFHPGVRAVDRVVDCRQHISQMRAGVMPIEILGEAFQIDVRRIHVPVEFRPRAGGHVSCRDRYRADAMVAAGVGGVDGIFGEHDGIVVRERDRRRAAPLRRVHDVIRLSIDCISIPDTGPRNIPVLAEPAAAVASGGAEAQDRGARMPMIERLFLHRVQRESRTASIRVQHDDTVMVGTHETEAPLTVAQLASARAQVALHTAVLQTMLPSADRRIAGNWTRRHLASAVRARGRRLIGVRKRAGRLESPTHRCRDLVRVGLIDRLPGIRGSV